MTKLCPIVMASSLCALASLSTAKADAFNVRPVPVSGSALQDALDAVTVGGPGVDVVADQSPVGRFTNMASSAVATFSLAIAPSSGRNAFGLFDRTDVSQRALLFDGSAASGEQKLISFLANGSVVINLDFAHPAATGFASPGEFGFFLDVFGAPVGAGGDGDDATLDYTLYTEDSLNPGGQAAALTFQGDDLTVLQMPTLAGGPFVGSEFLIAFDDGAPGTIDRDYADLVVLVESMTPIPEPTTGLLTGLGVGLFGWLGRRRR